MRTVIATVCLGVVLFQAATATAANSPSPVLDRAASWVAGHPVRVYCETDWREWKEGTLVFGYTLAPTWTLDDTVWVAPRVCRALHDRLAGKSPRANILELALALHILTHEAVHQRGGRYTDCAGTDRSCEGRTDCMALTLDEQVATRFFGIRRTVPTRRVDGWVAVGGFKRNPVLNDLSYYQRRVHSELLAPEYKGDC